MVAAALGVCGAGGCRGGGGRERGSGRNSSLRGEGGGMLKRSARSPVCQSPAWGQGTAIPGAAGRCVPVPIPVPFPIFYVQSIAEGL